MDFLGEQRTLQVIHPDFTFGRLTLTLFIGLNSSAPEFLLYNSSLGCAGITKDGRFCEDMLKNGLDDAEASAVDILRV